MLKNALSAPYVLKRTMDFNQTCIDILLGDLCKRTDLILVTLIDYQGCRRSKNVEKCLVCTPSPEGMNAF